MLTSLHNSPHHRIVLLFDLDCFYAQCERVRLGLPRDVCLALLQWNAVLAVTYPARNFGIKRGDTWDDVAAKSQNACWTIHLQILERKQTQQKVHNPYLKQSQSQRSIKDAEDTEHTMENQADEQDPVVANVEDAYNQIYNLTPEEQLECQKRERGVRRFHNEGKACLERYRLASMRIFSVVLESLTKRLGGKNKFVLERASIDEFYLDITNYCYQECDLMPQDMTHETVIVGTREDSLVDSSSDLQMIALQRASQISHWIRQDVLEILGFTMSAGICTNKMMAKLAATYGKPNGQALLHPNHFSSVLQLTKIRKVRHFGGKLGKQVLNVLQEHSSKVMPVDGNSATMIDLQKVPLPYLQNHFSEETANFIFQACRGVDHESVKETTGALVKSITAFKSFPATSNCTEIQNWLTLMANEVVDRVTKDAARNHRYPKSCTLNYTYYTTDSGTRPKGVTSTRSFRNTKSIRLNFPQEKSLQKVQDLVQQSLQKLRPILVHNALRGVGLSASNFESRGCPPEGVKGITMFFKRDDDVKDIDTHDKPNRSSTAERLNKRKRNLNIEQFFCQSPNEFTGKASTKPFNESNIACSTLEEIHPPDHKNAIDEDVQPDSNLVVTDVQLLVPSFPSGNQQDEDHELAKQLQASFDRENYVLSAITGFGPSHGDTKRTKQSALPKVRRIDSFFAKK